MAHEQACMMAHEQACMPQQLLQCWHTCRLRLMARQFLLRKVIHVLDALLKVGMQPRNLCLLVLDKRLLCTHLLTQRQDFILQDRAKTPAT